ncbi:MAG: hypothetical protein ACI31F_05810 [Muribaculaceae bacterium]
MISQPNLSKVRYIGSYLSITGLSVSDTEPGVYHNWSLTEAPHHQRVSNTLMMQVL